MIRITAIALFATLLLAGCGSKTPPAAEKRYPMEGTVKALDPAAKTATIDAGKIGDWMDAMTMEYTVKPDSELQKLHVGDHITATVVVSDPSFYVTDIKTVPVPAAHP